MMHRRIQSCSASGLALVALVVTSANAMAATPFSSPRFSAARGAIVLKNGKAVPISGAYLFRPGAPTRSNGGPRPSVATNASGAASVVNASVTGGFPSNEPAIAVDPNDPSHVIASANDYRFGDSESGLYSALTDPSSFTDTVQQYVESGPYYYNASGDPAVGIDGLGIEYFGTLAFDRLDGRSAVLVGRSLPADRGRFVSAPATPVDQQGATSSIFDDKDSLGVDTVASSAYAGSVYSAYTQFTPTASPIVAAYSRDQGRSFSKVGMVSKPGTTALCPADAGACADDQGSAFAIGPKGVVYVAYENFDTNVVADQILIAASYDGGATFGAPVKVATDYDISNPFNTFRVDSFPNIAVNAKTGRLYVVWGDQKTGSPEVAITTSPSGLAGTWTTPVTVSRPLYGAFRFFPAVAVARTSGDVFVSYYDDARYPGTDTCDYLYRRFSPTLNPLTAPTRVSRTAIFPDVAFGGGFFGDYTAAAPTPDGAQFVWTGTTNATQDIETARVR